jgi:sugar phosphate isomerase/epimerase
MARDAGLAVVNLIGFFEWLAEGDDRHGKALELARHAMDLAAQIGCPMIAAPPMGVDDPAGFSLARAADRYGELCEIGTDYGVVPVLEFWGHSRIIGRLGEALHVAAQSGRSEACVLADVFHMYKGRSPYEGLRLLGPNSLGLFHMNDFPADPPHAEISDGDRVYPGDGVAPLDSIFRDLHAAGFRGMLSLELFNKTYWQQDAREVTATGLAKMQDAVRRALPDA